MTCLSSFWNFRYPGGFLGFGGFSTAATELGSVSWLIDTPSPARRSVACRLCCKVLLRSVRRRSPCAHCNETLAHRRNGKDETVQR